MQRRQNRKCYCTLGILRAVTVSLLKRDLKDWRLGKEVKASMSNIDSRGSGSLGESVTPRGVSPGGQCGNGSQLWVIGGKLNTFRGTTDIALKAVTT